MGGGGGLEKRETRNGRGGEVGAGAKGERLGGEKIALRESEFGFVPRKAIS